jgi:hypothetical protein
MPAPDAPSPQPAGNLPVWTFGPERSTNDFHTRPVIPARVPTTVSAHRATITEYGVFSDVHLIYMWCSIVYFRMFENYPCDILLKFSLLHVFIFFFMLCSRFHYFLFMLCIYLFFMYIIIPISWT